MQVLIIQSLLKEHSKCERPASKDSRVHWTGKEHPPQPAGLSLIEPESSEDKRAKTCDHGHDEHKVISLVDSTLSNPNQNNNNQSQDQDHDPENLQRILTL